MVTDNKLSNWDGDDRGSPLSALDHMRQIFVAGAGGRKPCIPHAPAALEAQAQASMPADSWAYLRGGAGLEETMSANRAGFNRRPVLPRMLEDVSEAFMRSNCHGFNWPAPIFLSPIGVTSLFHREADLAIVSGVSRLGIPMVMSNQASHPMEKIAERLDGSPHYFQLYWSREEELTQSLVKRAEACGARGIILTLDTKLLGWRPRDLDRAHLPFLAAQGIAQYTSDPVFNALLAEQQDDPDAPKPAFGWKTPKTLATMLRHHPGSWRDNLKSGAPIKAARMFTQIYSNPALGRDHVLRLREMTDLPILLKGILHPDEADWAASQGCGVYVSNHGGRQVDGAIGAIDALPAVVKAVAGRAPVFFDSGIRCGADALKALALGADAVGIGRPYAYGLSIAGAEGVYETVRGLVSDLELNMRLNGITNISDLSPAVFAGEVSNSKT